MPRMRAAIGLAAASLLVLSAGLGVPAEPFRLVMPVVYGTHLPALAELAAQLAKLVDQLSGGTLELDLKQPRDGTQPQEILDKVSHGSVDAGFSTASFWGAKIPAAALFAGFPSVRPVGSPRRFAGRRTSRACACAASGLAE